jgi:hypothetical protein
MFFMCLQLAGKLNTISVTLAFNTLITPRLKFMVTISGFKGGMWTTGLVALSSDNGHHTLFESSAESGAKIGFGYWDNTRKTLVVRVAGVLKDYVSYSFRFNLVNPTYGQLRPTIIIGSSYESIGLSTCPPWARPLSSRVKLRIFNTSRDMDEGPKRAGEVDYPQAKTVVTYTLRSLEEGYSTVIHGCSVPGDDTEGILVPEGRWYMTMSSQGMFDITLELRTSIAAQEDGGNRMVVAQGTACGSDKTRSIYQDCIWWDMPSTAIKVHMQGPRPKSAHVVLTYGGEPVDMDLSVQFKNIKGEFTPQDKDCLYGDIMVGGGVYWGCRLQQILNIDEDGKTTVKSYVAFEKDSVDGFGPEVVYFGGVPDGEYHVNVRVFPSIPLSERVGLGDEIMRGAEEVKVYLPDGTVRAVYSSVRTSKAGMYWNVGYILVKDGRMSFRTLNRDQLTEDPQTYKSGYLLSFHIEVFSAKDGTALDKVTYECRSSGKLANAGELLSKGNLPQTTFEIENQIYIELADFGTLYGAPSTLGGFHPTLRPLSPPTNLAMNFPKQEYVVRLSKPGFNDQDVFVSFSGLDLILSLCTHARTRARAHTHTHTHQGVSSM